MIERIEIAVLGAGFGGLAVAHRLGLDGIDDIVIFERDEGVGGTWRANSYPGAACDVPSHLYSLSFAPNPNWSRAYAAQPEILAYIEDCYDRFELRSKVRLGTEIVAATWSDTDGVWTLRDRQGNDYEARVLVSAIGMFHTPFTPSLAGIEDYAGTQIHSARWDHDHDLANRRVALVGTGASAIQILPAIVDRAAEVVLYQRSAPWIMPRNDPPYTAAERQRFATHPEEAVQLRKALHDMLESSSIFLTGDRLAETIAGMSRDYLEGAVADPLLRAELTPDYVFGAKRVLISSDYYPALQRDNVELVTDPIERIVPGGIRTADGTERPADTIVWCTGFRAADYLRDIEVIGRDGVRIHDRWAGRPRSYHGIAMPDFPNFFMLYGPNTNQGGNSILLILEAQAQFVASALAALEETGAASIEVSPAAMDRYCEELDRDLATTVWADGAATYFHNATGDVVTQLPHKAGWYRAATEQVDCSDMELRMPRPVVT